MTHDSRPVTHLFHDDPHLGRVLALGELIDVLLKAFLHLRRGGRAVGNLQSLLQLLRLVFFLRFGKTNSANGLAQSFMIKF